MKIKPLPLLDAAHENIARILPVRQAEALVKWAKVQKVYRENFDAIREFPIITGSESHREHEVRYNEAEDLVYKITKPYVFRTITRVGYLRRLMGCNDLLGDEIKLVGVSEDALLTSQPFRGSEVPTEEEVKTFLREREYFYMDEGRYQNKRGIVIMDVFPSNFAKRDGMVFPIDVMVYSLLDLVNDRANRARRVI
jgi:hypothetical protein